MNSNLNMSNILLRLIAFILVASLANTSHTTFAQQEMRIAAVVNDDVISLYDIQSRVSLFLATSGLEDSQDLRRRLLPQVLQALIDERLKVQEARRLEIETSDEDVQGAVSMVEQQNGMQPGTFLNQLASQGVDPGTFYSQLEADVAWLKVVRESMSRDVNIADGEIQIVLDRLKANQGKPEHLVAEIFLPVNVSSREQDVRDLTQQLVERAREGTPFSALAQQFSQSPTAAVGGELGWVHQGELEDELDSVIANLEPGDISDPIRTITGYHIIALQDRRATAQASPLMSIVTLSQIYLQTTGRKALSPPRLLQLSQAIENQVSSCAQMNQWAEQIGGAGSGPVEALRIGALPEKVRDAVVTLPVGRISLPIEVGGARLYVVVCSLEEDDGLPTENQVYARLEDDKLDTMARQRLRDLRRQAIIDVRL